VPEKKPSIQLLRLVARLLQMHYGLSYSCTVCGSTASYCLKCYQAKGIVHPTDHEFEERGDEDDHESDIEADHSFTDDMDDNEYASDQAGEDEQTRT